jgi:hypothetical protein
MSSSIHKEARNALLVFLLMLTATGALAAGFTDDTDDDQLTTVVVQCGLAIKLRAAEGAKPTHRTPTASCLQAAEPAKTARNALDALPSLTAPPQLLVPLRR